MNSIPAILLLLSLAVQFVKPDKILVISFFSSKSHKITYMRLIEELASRGHQVTVVTPIKSGKEIKNIREVFTFDVEQMMGSFNAFEMKEAGQKLNPFMMVDKFDTVCRQSYQVPAVKALLKQDFDLIFFQPMFNDCALGLIHKLKAPLVLFMPVSAPNFIVDKLGGYFPPSFVSSVFLGYSDDMNFYERFINVGTNLITGSILKFYYYPYMQALYREELGDETIPGIAEILGNASLLLSNGHFALSRPKPYLPDVVDVGGIHSRPAKPLPKDLEDFVSKGKDGFILFSMGSAIKGEMMSDVKRDMFRNVFAKLKQQVVWKWESETMPNLPKNVLLSKWVPQQDLLGHKNARIFITHCGGGGTEEAIYYGVPLIGMPMFGDQDKNAQQAKTQGFLYQLNWNTLTEEDLMAGIQEVLNNKKYKESVQKLSAIFRDQPTDPLERGVYWVEYVLRHKGAPQLRSAARNLNYIQYHSLDVIAAYLAIIFGTLYTIFALLRWIVRKLCGGGAKDKTSLKQKRN